jgi:hypothetical protein
VKRQKIKRGASQTYDTPSFHEYEINGCNQAAEGCEMIPVQSLSLEEDIGDDGAI